MEDPLPQSSVDRSLLDRIVDPQARLSYAGSPLPVASPPSEPLVLLREWVASAVEDPRVAEPNAMVVATVDADGLPNARTVLLKGLDAVGFTFFTNLGSTKALELAAHPAASLVLLWHPMYRQVRVRGLVERVPDAEAAEYFAGRPRGSQVSAWASRQSQPVATRADVERAFAEAEARWAGSAEVPLPPFWGGYRVRPVEVPLPPFWGGYRVRPVEVEFWVGQASRLHDRLVYCSRDGDPQRLDDAAAWTTTRRQP